MAAPPERPGTDLYDLVSPNSREEYEVRDVLDCLVDAGSFDEYKAEYGQTLVCGTARIGGFPVGIVANQHHRVRPADGPIQFGGVLYVDSADKAARFIMNCNQDWLPIIFLQDVNGFMVGRDSEREGIIKAGAKLVNAISNSRVPKLTVIVGGSYGAGNYALCGKAFDPRFIFAWPAAHCAVMGGSKPRARCWTLRSRASNGRATRSMPKSWPSFATRSGETTIEPWTFATQPPAAGSTTFSTRQKPATR